MSTARVARPVAIDDTVLVGGTMSLLAATVHAGLAPDHFAEATWLGVAFVLAACGQTLWTVLALSGIDRRVVAFGLVVNLGCVACWALSRTVGLPGEGIEAVGVTDVLTAAAELSLCGMLVGLRGARRAGLVSAALLVCLLASGMAGHHH